MKINFSTNSINSCIKYQRNEITFGHVNFSKATNEINVSNIKNFKAHTDLNSHSFLRDFMDDFGITPIIHSKNKKQAKIVREHHIDILIGENFDELKGDEFLERLTY